MEIKSVGILNDFLFFFYNLLQFKRVNDSCYVVKFGCILLIKNG